MERRFVKVMDFPKLNVGSLAVVNGIHLIMNVILMWAMVHVILMVSKCHSNDNVVICAPARFALLK